MFDLVTCLGVVGAIFAVPVISYMAFITAMFAIYKKTGGKKGYLDYVAMW